MMDLRLDFCNTVRDNLENDIMWPIRKQLVYGETSVLHDLAARHVFMPVSTRIRVRVSNPMIMGIAGIVG